MIRPQRGWQPGQLCNRNPITVRRSDELIKAAQLMREKHIGYLMVVDPEVVDQSLQPVGVVTDRDIVVSVVARETDPRVLRVADVMTHQPVTISSAEPVERALREMRRIGVRRLPVVGQRGKLIGVLSLDDVLEVLAGELQNVAVSIRNERVIEGSLRT
jgi:CBS domain-containing protein